tara:strand:+ start:1065 stop:1433 length:369 start_codon:yes stop_codon:yes gene_type:complete
MGSPNSVSALLLANTDAIVNMKIHVHTHTDKTENQNATSPSSSTADSSTPGDSVETTGTTGKTTTDKKLDYSYKMIYQNHARDLALKYSSSNPERYDIGIQQLESMSPQEVKNSFVPIQLLD